MNIFLIVKDNTNWLYNASGLYLSIPTNYKWSIIDLVFIAVGVRSAKSSSQWEATTGD
jgi:hypothetical protein